MKNLLIILFLSLTFAGFSQGNAYIVKGEMPAEHAHLTLQYNKGNNTHVRQETDVVDGKFIFRGIIDAPYKVYLMVSYPGARAGSYDDHLEFFLDTGTTMIRTRDSLKRAVLSGTQLVTEGVLYDQPLTLLLADLTAEYDAREKAATDEEKKTDAYKNAMEAIDDSFLVRQKSMNIAFIQAHPDSRLCLYIFREQTYGYEYAELAPLWEGVSPTVRASIAGRQYATRLERLKMVALGQTAPDFEHPDSSGKKVRLSSFRGKYVLIDFWASWCGPCRGESPYLVAAYNKFKDRGFTVVGISLDKKAQRRQWLQAIAQDKLNWTQLSDLSDSNPIVQLYGVKGIPQNFLLDPDGKIIARNLRGAMLEKKLDAVITHAGQAGNAANVQKLMPFSVKGRIGHYSTPYKAYLSYVSPDGLLTDSVFMTDGNFTFSGMVKSPRKAYLSIHARGNGQDLRRDGYEIFFLEQQEVSVESPDSLSNIIVSGAKVNEDYKAFKAMLGSEKDREQLAGLEMNYMRDHPDSWVSLMTMLDDYYRGRALMPYKPLFDAFSPELKTSSTGQYLTPLFQAAEKTDIGVMAMDFTIPDATGRRRSLKEFRGKYVLVDFWASWCGPCRAENPNVLKAYNAFKGKGFTVVSVSIDDAKDKTKWIAAIKKDGMPWTQLSELKGWQSPVAQNYGILAIPQNFLLDPKGRIVAKDLRGDALMAKLSELIKK